MNADNQAVMETQTKAVDEVMERIKNLTPAQKARAQELIERDRESFAQRLATAQGVKDWEDTNIGDQPLALRIRSAVNAGVADAVVVAIVPILNAFTVRMEAAAERAEKAAERIEAAQTKSEENE